MSRIIHSLGSPHVKPEPRHVQINPSHPMSKGLIGAWLFNERAGISRDYVTGTRLITKVNTWVYNGEWYDCITEDSTNEFYFAKTYVLNEFTVAFHMRVPADGTANHKQILSTDDNRNYAWLQWPTAPTTYFRADNAQSLVSGAELVPGETAAYVIRRAGWDYKRWKNNVLVYEGLTYTDNALTVEKLFGGSAATRFGIRYVYLWDYPVPDSFVQALYVDPFQHVRRKVSIPIAISEVPPVYTPDDQLEFGVNF